MNVKVHPICRTAVSRTGREPATLLDSRFHRAQRSEGDFVRAATVTILAVGLLAAGCTQSPEERYVDYACDMFETYQDQQERLAEGENIPEDELVGTWGMEEDLTQAEREAAADGANMPRAERMIEERCGGALRFAVESEQQNADNLQDAFDQIQRDICAEDPDAYGC